MRVGAILDGLPGVLKVNVNVAGASVTVRYDAEQISARDLARKIDHSQYSCQEFGPVKAIGNWKGSRWVASADTTELAGGAHGTLTLTSDATGAARLGFVGEGGAEVGHPPTSWNPATAPTLSVPFTVFARGSPAWIRVTIAQDGESHTLSVPVRD